jgi:hypothetical protein
MATRFHLIVIATDFLGHVHKHEMTVVAANETELRDEIESFFSLRDVTDSWEINEVLEKQVLADSDALEIAYRESGAHSYHSR